MKIAILGDAHLISDSDPHRNLREHRDFFQTAWPSFQALLDSINRESPDLTILLGDLVDWVSPENMAFGLDLLSTLRSRWEMTPGNHDFAAPDGTTDLRRFRTVQSRHWRSAWKDQGVELGNRAIDCGDIRLILLDSALSDVAEGTGDWLARQQRDPVSDLLCTHVPIDLPATRSHILSVDPRRNLDKYVLSGAPDLYEQRIRNRFTHVFTGHLHFPGDLHVDATRFHLCDMCITMFDPNRQQGCDASALIVERNSGMFSFRRIYARGTASSGPHTCPESPTPR